MLGPGTGSSSGLPHMLTSFGTDLRQGGKFFLSPQHRSCPRSAPPLSALTTWPRKADSEPAAASRASGLDQQAAESLVTCSLMSTAPWGHERGRARTRRERCWMRGNQGLCRQLGPGFPSRLVLRFWPLKAVLHPPGSQPAPGPVPCCLPVPAWPSHPEELTEASCPPSGRPAAGTRRRDARPAWHRRLPGGP